MAKEKKSKSSKKSSGVLFTAACVVLGLLVILVIFLVKKDQIFTNLKETAFFDRVFGSTPEMIENHEPAPAKEKETIPLKNEELTIVIEPEKETVKTVEPVVPVKQETVEEKKSSPEKKEEQKVETSKKEEPKKEAAVATSEVQLCFVQFDGDGLVVRKVIKRTIAKNDSPLTNAINLLLKGPETTKAAEKNCQTLIPSGTKLLSAKVQNNVAYLNFNENIEFNEMGIEGTIHSLEQIVFTATAFSTVNSVQILVEGEKKPFLGSEGGPRIDTPLSRTSF